MRYTQFLFVAALVGAILSFGGVSGLSQNAGWAFAAFAVVAALAAPNRRRTPTRRFDGV